MRSIMRMGLWMLSGMAAFGLGCGSSSDGGPAGGGQGGSGGSAGVGGAAGNAGAGGASGATGCPAGSHEAAELCQSSLTGWNTAPSLQFPRDHHVTFIVETSDGAFLYAAGGVRDKSSAVLSTEKSALGPAGSVGPWESTSSLTEPVLGGGLATVGNLVVIAGGMRPGSQGTLETSTRVSVASVQPDGSIPNWSAGPELATTRFHGGAIAVQQFVYVLGGLTGAGTDSTPEVERAEVTNGQLGPWTQVTPYPDRRSHQAVAAHGSRLYSVGGLSGNPAGVNTTYGTVWRADVAADGTLSSWQTVSELPEPMATHSAVVHADSLYVLGGVAGSGLTAANTAAVYRAHILPDGGLTPWEAQTPLPKARAHTHQTPAHDGFIYSVAGAYQHTSMIDVFVGVLQ